MHVAATLLSLLHRNGNCSSSSEEQNTSGNGHVQMAMFCAPRCNPSIVTNTLSLHRSRKVWFLRPSHQLRCLFDVRGDGWLLMQALLAEVIERQRQITAARERSRTLVKPSEVQAAREQVQDEVEAVTVICKRVKAKLDELDTINAQLLDDDQASQLMSQQLCNPHRFPATHVESILMPPEPCCDRFGLPYLSIATVRAHEHSCQAGRKSF